MQEGAFRFKNVVFILLIAAVLSVSAGARGLHDDEWLLNLVDKWSAVVLTVQDVLQTPVGSG